MRKSFNLRNELKICLWIVLFLGGVMNAGFAANPVFTEHWKNLSGELNTNASDDVKPEIIIEGNTIHTVWIEYKYNETANIWYRRSTDLGKTWKEAQKIFSLVQKIDMPSLHSFARMMAVNGNTVHITFGDSEWTNTGAGRLYYARSLNGGQSFEPIKEISTTAIGAYVKMGRSQIVSVGNKVAIAYERERWIDGNNRRYDIRLLYSSDNGASFKDTLVVDATKSNSLCDFYYDGNQMIFLHHYTYYYYGFNTGRVYATISNDDGLNFTTTKISKEYPVENSTYEKSMVGTLNYYAYRQHIYKSGNNIHIVFDEYNNGWLVKYVRSTDNGATFADPISFEDSRYSTQGTPVPIITGKGDKVYIGYRKGSTFWLKTSMDGGATFSESVNHLDKAFTDAHGDTWSWAFNLSLNPLDDTGSTVLITSNTHLLATITDNGTKLKDFISCIGERAGNMVTNLAIDSNGIKHWFIYHKPTGNTDYDIYYRSTGTEPEPGEVNKAFELPKVGMTGLIIPYSESLDFDSLLTVEMWAKFNPTKTYGAPLIWKTKSEGYYEGTSKGFGMRYTISNGKINIRAQIRTDKEQFTIGSPTTITDTLWHHLAFTYDANGGLDNFIAYIDGLPVVKTTVTGKIEGGNEVISLAPFGISENEYYKMDEVRIWKKALTPAEIQQGMTRKDFSNEKDLKCYITYDDTFKDISGNGNDAVPMKMADRVISDFNPPVVAFETYKVLNEVSTINKTINATAYSWTFGDKSTSKLQNPKHQYAKPGEYEINLVASNDNAVTSSTDQVSIAGIDRIHPTRSGNRGYITLDVYGGALTASNTKVILRKEGNADIESKEVKLINSGNIQAEFLFDNESIGNWDVVIVQNGTEVLLPDAFTLENSTPLDNWVRVLGRGATLFNRWQSYRISYGNNSNVDCYAVPLWIAITESSDLEIEFVDFEMDVPEYYKNHSEVNDYKALGEYFVTDRINGVSKKMRVIPVMIPVIRANSSSELTIRIKTGIDVEIIANLDRPMITSDDLIEANASGIPPAKYIQQAAPFSAECVVRTLGMGILDATTTAIPAAGCVWGGMKIGYTVYSHVTSKKPSFWNTLWNIGLTTADCGVSLAKNIAFPIAWGMAMINLGNAVYDLRNCREPNDSDEQDVRAVSSFDPNEIIGPNGHGDENWIRPMNEVPYTILFENKSTATAPAHDVIITDTLDTSVFDLSNFSFDKYGWGDSIFYQSEVGASEFSRDIDLRPAKNLLVRVSGKLDKENGVIKFEFKSLNPETFAEEEDPFLGFLPPNNENHAGEGFVSFNVGLKPNLNTGTKFKNKASIVFDANAPIITNEFVNTIDTHIPTSVISKIDKIGTDSLRINWTSSDEGSGIRNYMVYAQKDDEEILPVLINVVGNSGTIRAEQGATYKFFSEATDNAGWKENKNGKFDVVFVNTGLNNLTADNYFSILPNPAKDYITIQLKETLPADSYDISLLSIDGRQLFTGSYSNAELNNGVKIKVNNFAKGLYLIKITYDNKVVSKKVVVE